MSETSQAIKVGARPLSMSLSDWRAILLLVDVALLNIALMTVAWWRLDHPWGLSGMRRNPEWYLLLTLIWLLIARVLHIYHLRQPARLGRSLSAVIAPWIGLLALYLAIPYATPPVLQSRLTTFLFAGACLGALVIGRVTKVAVLSRPRFRRRILIIGSGEETGELMEAIREHGHSGYKIAGKLGTEMVPDAGLLLLGGFADLPEVLNRYRISDAVVSTTPAADEQRLVETVLDCRERGIEVALIPDLYEQLTGRVSLQRLSVQNLALLLPPAGEQPRLYEAAKRLIDLTIGLAGLVLLAAVSIIIIPLILLDHRGPIFIRQRRVGRGGRAFTLWKFRTMVPNAEENGPRWAVEDDSRVTTIGWLLRKTHLDELSQAINLVTGEMSFIGPRPERPEFVADLERVVPFYRARHAVKPGITGWAQVNYPYGASVDDARIKLQYDLYYIKHASLSLDVQIAIGTIGLVLALRGR